MINKIYDFQSDVTIFCSFIQGYSEGEESIIGRAMRQRWDAFDNSYKEVSLELRSNEQGKKIINLILVVLCRHLWFLVKMHYCLYLIF